MLLLLGKLALLSMTSNRLFIGALMLLLGACAPIDIFPDATGTPPVTIVTNTPPPTAPPPTVIATDTATAIPSTALPEAVTPTQEKTTHTPVPGANCEEMEIAAGTQMVSANPCLGSPVYAVSGYDHPNHFTVAYTPNPEVADNPPQFNYDGDSWPLDMSYMAGRFGLRFDVELRPGVCYFVKLAVDSSLAYVDYYGIIREYGAYAIAHVDDGRVLPLIDQGLPPNEEAAVLWGFQVVNPITVSFEVGIRLNWALALHGSQVYFQELGVYETPNLGYCTGAPRF